MYREKIEESLLRQFKLIVGKDHFFDEYEIRWTYAFGGSIFNKDWIPDVILIPQNLEQVSKILSLANKNRIPITPRGSGTTLSEGTMTPYGGIILDLSQMNEIISIDIPNTIVEVEPGVICDNLNEILKLHGYFFPPDPGSSSVATIGGMVANNAGGIQAFKYGVTKNYVLYIEVVLVDGTILILGTKVLKSVSSYNLKDLFIGSEGTLGIITKIGLRIIPLPSERKLGFFIFEKIDDLLESVIELRKKGIVPNLLEFIDHVTISAVYEYLGGDFLCYPEGEILMAEVDGNNPNAVDAEFALLFDIIIKNKPIFHKIARSLEERDILISARKSNLPALSRIAPSVCAEDCSIQITDLAKVVKKIWEIPKKIGAQNLKVACISHMEGNLHPTFLFNENNPEDIKEFENALKYLYEEIILPVGGSLTGEHGIGKVKTPFLELEHGKNTIDLMLRVKKLLDPNYILNPGSGKGNIAILKKNRELRQLKNHPKMILELNCMRCGFCTVTCPSKDYYIHEGYTPRGRLSLLNGLVHGELELNERINDIFHACSLCGLCSIKCPAGIKLYQIFEKVRELIHENQ